MNAILKEEFPRKRGVIILSKGHKIKIGPQLNCWDAGEPIFSSRVGPKLEILISGAHQVDTDITSDKARRRFVPASARRKLYLTDNRVSREDFVAATKFCLWAPGRDKKKIGGFYETVNLWPEAIAIARVWCASKRLSLKGLDKNAPSRRASAGPKNKTRREPR